MAPILPISAPALVEPLKASGGAGGGSFGQAFANAIQSVEGANQDANASVQRFLTGEGEELHNTVLATTRAQMAFDMFLQTRNKVVSAYQEIMRMQL
jgi:flagellar hook-basal body complex protein FliE